MQQVHQQATMQVHHMRHVQLRCYTLCHTNNATLQVLTDTAPDHSIALRQLTSMHTTITIYLIREIEHMLVPTAPHPAYTTAVLPCHLTVPLHESTNFVFRDYRAGRPVRSPLPHVRCSLSKKRQRLTA